MGVTFTKSDSQLNPIEKWHVKSFSAPALGHAMNQLVDKLWVEAALKDPAAKFQEGDVVAIEAKTSCLPTASIVVNCHWEI